MELSADGNEHYSRMRFISLTVVNVVGVGCGQEALLGHEVVVVGLLVIVCTAHCGNGVSE